MQSAGRTATMEHNDAINNKQASWEACKLFWLKLKLGTSHKTHTKLCRIRQKFTQPSAPSLPPASSEGFVQPKSSSVCVKLIVVLVFSYGCHCDSDSDFDSNSYDVAYFAPQCQCRRSMAAIFKPKQSYRLHTLWGVELARISSRSAGRAAM